LQLQSLPGVRQPHPGPRLNARLNRSEMSPSAVASSEWALQAVAGQSNPRAMLVSSRFHLLDCLLRFNHSWVWCEWLANWSRDKVTDSPVSRHRRIRIGITLAARGRSQNKTDSLVWSTVWYKSWSYLWDLHCNLAGVTGFLS